MKFLRHCHRLVTGAVIAVVGCTGARPAVDAGAKVDSRVLLVSVDGLRWDFMDRTNTPTLDWLASRGARARRLVPVFPTKTFPSHYSIATGLYPEHHGIVSNTQYDPVFDATFRLNSDEALESRWWEGEPIWVTAERNGQRSATFFWPGTDVEISGVRPREWRAFDPRVPTKERVEQVVSWLTRPDSTRPRLVTLYFGFVDNAAHRNGPDSPAVTAAVERFDRALEDLVSGLRRDGGFDNLNIILVSDHGMAEVSRDRVIYIDDYLDRGAADVIEWSPVLALRPKVGREQDVYEALLGAHDHLRMYRKHEIPERLHYRDHRRIPPIIGIADEGWTIGWRGCCDDLSRPFSKGMHGFDPVHRTMHGMFVASGPAFQKDLVVDSVLAVDVYGLVAHVLGLPPAPNDGDFNRVRMLLRR